MITEFEKSVFKFLDELRDSGTTNMFGATLDVEKEFDLEKRHAKNLLTKWMEAKWKNTKIILNILITNKQ